MDRQRILNYLRKQLDTTGDIVREYATGADGKAYPIRPPQKIIKDAVGGFLEGQPDIDRWWVMPGLRGVGKTTLMAQTYLQLNDATSSAFKAHLLWLTLDEIIVSGFKLTEILEVYQTEILGDYFEKTDRPIFIFIDETQADADWATALKAVYDRSQRVFILCSGSSALHLQMDANVAGRRARIETLHPLSFSEFQLLAYNREIDDKLRLRLNESLYAASSAGEVYEQLQELRSDVNRYWTACKPDSLSAYLRYGTLPFVLNRPEALFHRRVQTIVDKVLNADLRAWQNFNTASLSAMPRLLSIIATAGDVVSLPKLSQALGVSRPQLLQILEALVKAELLIKVPAHGRGPLSASRRPAKYLFTSAAVRASYFDLAGDPDTAQRRRGQLLEDAAALHYRREFIAPGKGALSYSYHSGGERQCDFILHIGNHKSIATEFGLGEKDSGQVVTTMRKIKCQYGLVFSQSGLDLERQRDIVKVPLDYFFLL